MIQKLGTVSGFRAEGNKAYLAHFQVITTLIVRRSFCDLNNVAITDFQVIETLIVL